MRLRSYTGSDFEAILALTIEVFGPFLTDSLRPAVGEAIFTAQHGDWRGDYRLQLGDLHDPANGKHVLVAEDGAELIGFTAWSVDARQRAWIDFVAVRPSHRRTGTATALCRATFAALRADGVGVVGLGTGGDGFHAAARALYDSLGMTPFPNVVYFREP